MLITNLTDQDYWFGPLHLPAGNGQTLTVDDTSATSLYLTDDSVADAINTLYAATPAKIQVTGAAAPFPRATGVPEVLHGDGSPEGIVYAGQGSIYLRRDNTGGAQLYQKTTGIHVNTGWIALAGAVVTTPTGALHIYGGTTAPAGWLLCDGSAVSRATYADLFATVGVSFGSGDGSTTFNVPDLRGRLPVGYGGAGGHVDVAAIGKTDGSALANRRPKHQHAVYDSGHQHVPNYAGGSANPGRHMAIADAQNFSAPNQLTASDMQAATTGIRVNPEAAASSSSPQDAPAYVVVNYIIKT